jgi:uncharacterized protein
MEKKENKRAIDTAYELALKEATRKNPRLSIAAALLERAHSEGDRRATYALATWHLHGHAGYSKDLKVALALFKLAALAHHPEANFELAVCYENGEGVRKNDKRAYIHYLAAALFGDTDALTETGRCLYYGIGTNQDRKAAEVWFKKAESVGLEIR